MDKSNGFGQFTKINLPKRCENIAAVMRQVQECPWNPFKLNEIVTLEKCLQEVSIEDPRFSLILRKIANESVFVDPSRKLRYLKRTKQEELADNELKRQATELRSQIDKLDKKIDYYRTKLENLLESENTVRLQIFQIQKSIVSKDNICKLLFREFGLLLERVFNSFVTSMSIIKVGIPEFISAVNQCKLVKQTQSLPILHRRFLIKLIKNNPQISHNNFQQLQQISIQFSYHFKKSALSHLNGYLKAVTNLYRDLALIDKVYTTEIPEELDHLKLLETHINYLEKPIRKAPKKVTYIHHDLGPVEQPQLTSREPDQVDDPELGQMFSLVTKLCKYSSEGADQSTNGSGGNNTG